MSNGVDFRKMAVELRGQLTAAQVELAALREELANTTSVAKSEIEGLSLALQSSQQRLTAAEQRNATLETELRNIRQFCELSKLRDARIDALLTKPTESGASE